MAGENAKLKYATKKKCMSLFPQLKAFAHQDPKFSLKK